MLSSSHLVDKLNELLVYPHTTFTWSCTKLVKCDNLTKKKLFDLCFKIHTGHHWSRSKFMLSSSIIVDKRNELLVYLQRKFLWTYKKI